MTLEVGAVQPIAYQGLPQLYDVDLQVVGVGAAFRSHDLADWSVSESVDNRTAWSATVAPFDSEGDRGPLGLELDWFAPPPGKLPVDLSVIYLSAAGGEASYKLISGGVTDNSERPLWPASMQLQGLGKMGHYDRRRVTLKIPARSGKTHGRILIELAQAAGVPAAEIKIPESLGAPRLKAYDIIDEDFPVVAGEVAEACGYAIDFNRDGDLVAIPLVPTGPAVAEFRPQTIVADGEASIRAQGEVPTCLIFEGSAPEGNPSQAGRIEKIKEVIIKGELSLEYAAYQQDASPSSTGTLIATGVASPVVKQDAIKQRTTIREIYVDGCLEQRWTIEETYYNPVAARYQIDTAGAPSVYKFCFIFDPDAMADDTAEAYAWPIAKLVPTRIVAEGFRYDSLGRLRRVDTVVGAWRNREASIKQRAAPSDDWESQDFVDNQLTEGSGRGVAYDSEKWFEGRGFHSSYTNGWSGTPSSSGAGMSVDGDRVILWSEVQTKEITNTVDNFVTLEETEVRGIGAEAGYEYLFHGGSEHQQQEEEPGYIASGEVVIYDAAEGGGLTTISTAYLPEGKVGDQTITRGDGYLPASELCDGELSDRASNRTIEVKVCAYEDAHVQNEQRVSNDFVESEGEAEAYLWRIFQRAVPPRIRFSAPISAGIERAMVLSVYAPGGGVEHEGWVDEIQHVATADGRAVSTVTLVVRDS